MLIIKYKNKKMEGMNPIDFYLGDTEINYNKIGRDKTLTRSLSAIESILVDGVEIFRCVEEL